jgi:16S rRNA (guanine527-N7)-methyltransferase
VKHHFDLERFFVFLGTQNIVLSEKQKEQFFLYEQLIKNRSGKQNLVSKNDIRYLVERHFFPSAFLSAYLPNKIDGSVIDIGTGAGFPRIMLKILRPQLSLTLLDSSHKKVLFLEEVREQLDLDCRIINQRCEEYHPPSTDRYQIAVSRAVARLNLLWGWSGHLIVPGGLLYALKGGDYQPEIDELSVYNLKSEVISPDKHWLKTSEYLNNKCIVKLEK